jgi:hypothetical protein
VGESGKNLDGIGGGPQRWWGRTSTAVEEDLDGGGGAHGGGAGVRHEPQQWVRVWHGPRRWRWCSIEAHTEEERSVRHRRGGGRRSVEVDAEEERTPVGVWRENDSVRV